MWQRDGVSQPASVGVFKKSGLPCGVEGSKGLALALGISGVEPGQGASRLAGPLLVGVDAPSRLRPPELCPGTARLGKPFCAIRARSKSRSSESHPTQYQPTQLVGFRDDPRRSAKFRFWYHRIPLHVSPVQVVQSTASGCYTVTGSGPSVCLSRLPVSLDGLCLEMTVAVTVPSLNSAG